MESTTRVISEAQRVGLRTSRVLLIPAVFCFSAAWSAHRLIMHAEETVRLLHYEMPQLFISPELWPRTTDHG